MVTHESRNSAVHTQHPVRVAVWLGERTLGLVREDVPEGWGQEKWPSCVGVCFAAGPAGELRVGQGRGPEGPRGSCGSLDFLL